MKIAKEVFLELKPYDETPRTPGNLFMLDKSLQQYNEHRAVYVGLITDNQEYDYKDIIEIFVVD